MFQRLKELSGYTVHGLDGDIGTADEFYFDDNQWVVRYVLIHSGEWLNGRHVLLSTHSFSQIDAQLQVISVDVDRAKVRNSPDVSLSQPYTRRDEVELLNYYDWPFYWDITQDQALGAGNLAAVPLVDLAFDVEQQISQSEMPENRLRRTDEVFGYTIQARDGKIGNLQDFIVEDKDWKILYLVVNTGTWLSERNVLVSPSWIERISWPEESVYIDLKKETIAHSPEFETSGPLDRDYEIKLYDHYGKKKYWD